MSRWCQGAPLGVSGEIKWREGCQAQRARNSKLAVALDRRGAHTQTAMTRQWMMRQTFFFIFQLSRWNDSWAGLDLPAPLSLCKVTPVTKHNPLRHTHTGQPETVIRQQVMPSSTLPAPAVRNHRRMRRPKKNHKSITFNPINEMIGDIWLLIFSLKKNKRLWWIGSPSLAAGGAGVGAD